MTYVDSQWRKSLLIEPIGIEIGCQTSSRSVVRLLIEPIGIEMIENMSPSFTVTLLIEPIGIEMEYQQHGEVHTSPFNWTYWNWNTAGKEVEATEEGLLIEPIGIEIQG